MDGTHVAKQRRTKVDGLSRSSPGENHYENKLEIHRRRTGTRFDWFDRLCRGTTKPAFHRAASNGWEHGHGRHGRHGRHDGKHVRRTARGAHSPSPGPHAENARIDEPDP